MVSEQIKAAWLDREQHHTFPSERAVEALCEVAPEQIPATKAAFLLAASLSLMCSGVTESAADSMLSEWENMFDLIRGSEER